MNPQSLSRLIGSMGMVLVAATATAAEPGGDPTTGRLPPGDCFYVTQWHNWKSPNPNLLYLGVGLHDVYRVDLSDPSFMLSSPGMHLVLKVRGSDSICSALDLDLSVADQHGIPEPIFAKSITKMAPDDVAAIPAKFRP